MSEITQIGPLGDEAKVNKRRKDVDLMKEQEVSDLQSVMSTPTGRRMFAWILKETEFGSVAFYETDRITAFMLGQQNVGHKLMSQAREHCLDMVRLMEDEERSWQKQQ